MQSGRASQEPVGADAAAHLAQAWGLLYTQRLAASAERLPTDDGEPASSGGARAPSPGRMTELPDDLRCAHRSAGMLSPEWAVVMSWALARACTAACVASAGEGLGRDQDLQPQTASVPHSMCRDVEIKLSSAAGARHCWAVDVPRWLYWALVTKVWRSATDPAQHTSRKLSCRPNCAPALARPARPAASACAHAARHHRHCYSDMAAQ